MGWLVCAHASLFWILNYQKFEHQPDSLLPLSPEPDRESRLQVQPTVLQTELPNVEQGELVRLFRLRVPPPFVDRVLRLRLAGIAVGTMSATTDQANNFTLRSGLFGMLASRSPGVKTQSTCCGTWAGHRTSLRQLVGTCFGTASTGRRNMRCSTIAAGSLGKRLRCRHGRESGSLGTQRGSMGIPCLV